MSDGVWGLIGVLIGAAVAGGVTWKVTQWQAGEQLRQNRLDKLDDLVVVMFRQAAALSEAAQRRGDVWPATEALVRTGGLVVARSRVSSPWLSRQVEVGVEEVLAPASLITGALTHPGAEGPIMDPQLHPDLEERSWALYGLLVQWMSGAERFEEERPTFESAMETVRKEYR